MILFTNLYTYLSRQIIKLVDRDITFPIIAQPYVYHPKFYTTMWLLITQLITLYHLSGVNY